MRSRKRARLVWKTRKDGSAWAQFEIGGETGLVAVVPFPTGEASATAIVEIKRPGSHACADDAQSAAENWLIEVGGRPLDRITTKVLSTKSSLRRSS